MVASGGLNTPEAQNAAWEGGRGAISGAAKWGLCTALIGGAGYVMSPIYRGLTIQFKVFLQMSGACLEADRRIREYEAKIRLHKRMIKDQATRKQYDETFEERSPTRK